MKIQTGQKKPTPRLRHDEELFPETVGEVILQAELDKFDAILEGQDEATRIWWAKMELVKAEAPEKYVKAMERALLAGGRGAILIKARAHLDAEAAYIEALR